MHLLTWHGSLICLPDQSGVIRHHKLPLGPEAPVPLDLDIPPSGSVAPVRHAELGVLHVQRASRPNTVFLVRDGKLSCAEAETGLVRFDRDHGGEWETFLPIAPGDLRDLSQILGARWIMRETRQLIRRSAVVLAEDFVLRIGRFEILLAHGLDGLVKARDADGLPNHLVLPLDGVELVIAEPRGSALLDTALWPVRARRVAEILTLAVHRQVIGTEPTQEIFERDTNFLQARQGAAGLEDLLEIIAEAPHAGEVKADGAERLARVRDALADFDRGEPGRQADGGSLSDPVNEASIGRSAREMAQQQQKPAKVVALGVGCVTAIALREASLDSLPFPFDWWRTTPAMIRHCLQTDFEILLDRSQYCSLTGLQAPDEPEHGCDHEFYKRDFKIGRLFNHNDPTREPDYRYTLSCIDRFRDLLASSEPKLFVQCGEIGGLLPEDFRQTADLLDSLTSSAMLLQIEVTAPIRDLARPAIKLLQQRGRHQHYRLQPTSQLGGERFQAAIDTACLIDIITNAREAATFEHTSDSPSAERREAQVTQGGSGIDRGMAATRASDPDAVDDVLMGWALREMAPWQKKPVSRAYAEQAFDDLNDSHRWMAVFDFDDGDVRMRAKPEQHGLPPLQGDRARYYLDFFRSVAPLLPRGFRTSLCMGLADALPSSYDVPVFCFQKHAGWNNVLLPDIDFLTQDFYTRGGLQDRLRYADKDSAAVFAGGTSGGLITPEVARDLSLPRLRAAKFFENSERVDFRLPGIGQCTTPEAEELLRAQKFCQRPTLTWPDQYRYRMLISMDGNGATCSRVALALHSNSVLLKYESVHGLYYFGGLQPWVHYVPVEEDADVERILDLEARDPDRFARIAANGRSFAQTYLGADAARRYTAMLLQVYADSFTDSAAPVKVTRHRRNYAPLAVIETSYMLAHIQNRGDQRSALGAWMGEPGSTLAVEGFAISLGAGLPAKGFSYQAVLANGVLSEVARNGEYRGTRGENLPTYGICITTDSQFAGFDLEYEATFIDGTRIGPVPSGTLCKAPSGKQMEALRVTILQR